MAGRPPLGRPKRQRFTLTVSEETRFALAWLSRMEGKPISQLVEEWTSREVKRVRRAGEKVPDFDGNQERLDV